METDELTSETVIRPEKTTPKTNFTKAILEITGTSGNSDNLRIAITPVMAMTWRVNVFFRDHEHHLVGLWFIAKSFYLRFGDDGKPVIVEQYISPRLNGVSS